MIRFYQPAALFGLVAALAPIIIYFLLRRRRQEVPWGASYLLRLTLATKRRTSIWKQLVVLAVRVLVLGLVAVSIARPWQRNPHPTSLAPRLPDEPVHRIVLLDNSLSMSAGSADDSRLGRLRGALKPLLQSQRSGDAIALIPLLGAGDGGDPTTTLVGALPTATVRDQLGRVILREGKIDLSRPLVLALESLKSTPDTIPELYVLSDFPRELADGFASISWFQQVVEERQVRISPVNMISPDGASQANVSVRSVSIGADTLLADVPTVVYVDVTNYSDDEVSAQLDLNVDGAPGRQKAILLQPNEHKRVAAALRFPRAGISALEVGVDKGHAGMDAGVVHCVEVKKAAKVWVYADEADPREATPLTEADLLLRGSVAREGETTRLELTPIGVYELAEPIPNDVDAILFAGPRVVTPKMGEYLSAFVRGGGGLIIAMSPKLDISFYNENLAQLLPAPLVGSAREEIDAEVYVLARPEPSDSASELFSEFGTDVSGELDEVRFYNHMKLDSPREADTVFRLANGDPLLMHREFGRGHVYLFTSSLGVSWSSMPVRQSFVPLLHRLVQAAIAGRGFRRNIAPGEAFVAAWPGPQPAKLVAPGGEERTIAPTKTPQGNFAIVEGAEVRGLHELRSGDKRVEAFTVTGQFAEPDLRTLTEKQCGQLAGLLGHSIYPDWHAAIEELEPADSAPELWALILALVAALYLFETWFVRFL